MNLVVIIFFFRRDHPHQEDEDDPETSNVNHDGRKPIGQPFWDVQKGRIEQ